MKLNTLYKLNFLLLFKVIESYLYKNGNEVNGQSIDNSRDSSSTFHLLYYFLMMLLLGMFVSNLDRSRQYLADFLNNKVL